MKLKEVKDEVTFGVSCVGNVQALYMCLASVMNASVVPKCIQVRFEGPLPAFGTFYMEQLSELARFLGIDFLMTVASSEGVRVARDWHLNTCKTKWLWMGDDDVIYGYDCLEYLMKGAKARGDSALAYLCGTKGDLNNRRGWGNFKMDVHSSKDVHDNCAFNWFYDKEDCDGLYPQIYTCDTGNCLIHISNVTLSGIQFKLFPLSLNSGGEDTIFALECGKVGLNAYMVPSAQAFHLEKEKVNFNEHAARAEMVLRVADLRGYKKPQMDYVKEIFFPWLFKK